VPPFPLGDSNTLGVWLNGYVNGARGKTLIDPLSAGRTFGGLSLRRAAVLVSYCLRAKRMRS
jgi:hypothetical protein